MSPFGINPEGLFLSPTLLILFLSSLKDKESKRKVQKRPVLGGRNPIFSKHSMNSLRSNSISYFVAWLIS